MLHQYLGMPYRLHVRHVRKPERQSRATVVFLHGIGSSGSEWREVIESLPSDISVIAIDLLGFGRSPKPDWAKYSANEQAKSVVATLLRQGITRRVIVVGHSLGALVAVEVTKRYPMLVDSLVLCAPPLYVPDDESSSFPSPKPDKLLKYFFDRVENNPNIFIKLTEFAVRQKLVNPVFSLTQETFPSFLQTLNSAIFNQTTYFDLIRLRRPITIMYGSFDPFVVDKNIRRAKARNSHISTTRVLSGHEISGRFVPAITKTIIKHVDKKTRPAKQVT